MAPSTGHQFKFERIESIQTKVTSQARDMWNVGRRLPEVKVREAIFNELRQATIKCNTIARHGNGFQPTFFQRVEVFLSKRKI